MTGASWTPIRRFVGFSMLGMVLLLAAPAMAADLHVDCAPGNPSGSPFTSITAALNALAASPPSADENWILLRSDCTDNVSIGGGFHRLWIAPEWDRFPWAGQTTNGPFARITAADPTQAAVMSISGASDVRLVHLTLSGAQRGLWVNGNSHVDAYGLIAENSVATSSGVGIEVGGGATLNLGEGGARNNGNHGISVGDGSTLALFGRQSWLQNKPFIVSGNGGDGVYVGRGTVSVWAGVEVENNQGLGLQSYGGDIAFGAICCDQASFLRGNNGGAFLSEGTEASFWGDMAFHDNGAFGVYAEKGSHATFYELSGGPAGTAVLVEGHTEVGVSAVMNSQAAFHGANRIRGNGSGAVPTSAGIRVDGNSQAFFEKGIFQGSTRVVDNIGPGILADLNSSVDARDVVVRGNTKEGVRVRHRSVVDIGSDSRIRPNGDGPLTCDATSLVITSLVGANAACGNVETPSEPRPTRPEPLQ